MPALGRFAVLCGVALLAACEGQFVDKADKTRDTGIDSKDLSELKSGIWIDPNGCDHWIVDDGLEGYMSQRLDAQGKPVCSRLAPPSTAVGGFQDGPAFTG